MTDPSYEHNAPGTRTASLCLYAIALAVALHFSIDYLNLTFPMIAFNPYVHGQIGPPFRYRILVAWIYRGFAAIMGGHRLPHLIAPFDSQQGWFLVLLCTASLMVAVYATGQAIRSVTGSSRYRWLSLLVLEMAYFNYILPPHRALFYPYDLPALAFFAVLTWLALEARYLWFAIVFVPATMNRETAIYALLLFLLLNIGRQPAAKLLAYGAGLTAVFAGIKYALYVLLHQSCQGCPALAENQLGYNLRQLANPVFWVAAASVFAYAWVALFPLWKHIDTRLRRSFTVLIWLWTVPMFLVAILRELRVFAELSPFLIVLLANGLSGYLASRNGRVVGRPAGQAPPQPESFLT